MNSPTTSWLRRSCRIARTTRGENCPIASCTATSVSESTTLVRVTSRRRGYGEDRLHRRGRAGHRRADDVKAGGPIDRQQRRGEPDADEHAGQRHQPQPSLGQVTQPEALNPPHDCGHPWITTTTVIYPPTPGPIVRAWTCGSELTRRAPGRIASSCLLMRPGRLELPPVRAAGNVAASDLGDVETVAVLGLSPSVLSRLFPLRAD